MPKKDCFRAGGGAANYHRVASGAAMIDIVLPQTDRPHRVMGEPLRNEKVDAPRSLRGGAFPDREQRDARRRANVSRSRAREKNSGALRRRSCKAV